MKALFSFITDGQQHHHPVLQVLTDRVLWEGCTPPVVLPVHTEGVTPGILTHWQKVRHIPPHGCSLRLGLPLPRRTTLLITQPFWNSPHAYKVFGFLNSCSGHTPVLSQEKQACPPHLPHLGTSVDMEATHTHTHTCLTHGLLYGTNLWGQSHLHTRWARYRVLGTRSPGSLSQSICGH